MSPRHRLRDPTLLIAAGSFPAKGLGRIGTKYIYAEAAAIMKRGKIANENKDLPFQDVACGNGGDPSLPLRNVASAKRRGDGKRKPVPRFLLAKPAACVSSISTIIVASSE
ncbi:MAG: hypothetical protein A2V52_06205 [Actinobacteria bacterium RBG_19FT_COMBO_54_7]|uniref:Uncharacterized protein n=1 Tax=Candidatus Solincola sediminis TaxID=1797199 RepID=A0A1F2WRC6_9ACTN|nr:MAG: hypothetical protein A2Y75_11220 [Candidatus Solincola sediminis]OFW60231.1 MAG: hypothetical protein A2W01_08840 [Candidatus Solincola sediminis]OFW70406.1 MAG: hypothetical protein A2V52_06205 [Actinobacteria bacterium RBG_19FT_COMBO_54_7]